MPESERLEFRPQPGPQEMFAACTADIALYGGEAGGGKSWGIVFEAARHSTVPGYGGIIFRRNSTQIRGSEGLWEESRGMYPYLGGHPREHMLEWRFPSSSIVAFAHLEYERNKYDHQGKGYAFIGFDELTHFTESQFWYLFSRNRSTCGVTPYMRATTNPDADSWVAKLCAWWIDTDGFAIPERSGILRWFLRDGDIIHWANSPAELAEQFPHRDPLEFKSFTFIHATLDDNPALTKADPGYRGRIMALPSVERERLARGNWKIRPKAGEYIQDDWFLDRYDELPRWLRYYITSDYAVTEPKEGNDPDWTVHAVWAVDHEDNLYAVEWWRGQTKSDVWITQLIRLMKKYKPTCYFGERGQIIHAVGPVLRKMMKADKVRCRIELITSARDKATRGRSLQARASMGQVIFPKKLWADQVVTRLVGFVPNGTDDDDFDAAALMSRVIDETHPAYIPASERPVAPREPSDYGENTSGDTDNWKTA